MIVALRRFAGRWIRDRSGVALIEFGFMLPIFILMGVTGAELTNFITVKMRISQLALHLADNAARMGSGSQLQSKRVTENDINDLFIGANLQSGELDLRGRGRMILSSLEEDPANAGKYRIRWQRCYGTKTGHNSGYGAAGATNLTGMGPSTRQVTVQTGNATMFVEVYYEYQPLVGRGTIAPVSNFIEIASMSVRDRRDLAGGTNGVYPVTGVTAATC